MMTKRDVVIATLALMASDIIAQATGIVETITRAFYGLL
jgi:hypothetical protein